MAWSQAYLTDVGKQLQASVMANELKLHIEEIWLGDGNISNIASTNELGAKKLKLSIAGIMQDNTECLVRFRISNESIQSPIVMREIGFYARDKRGQLILYSIMKDEDPSTLPVANGQAIYRQNMNVAFGFSNAQQVTCNVTLHEGLNEQQVDAKITAHNNNESAHHLERYAGGATIPNGINNWNDLVVPGIYESNTTIFGWSNAPAQSKVYPYGQIQVHKTDGNVITQEFYSYGQGTPCKKACRTFYQTWSAWQYFLDWDNSITEITKADGGINVTKGGATELLKLFTSDKADSNTALAPTLSVVKALIGDVNVDVTSLLQSKGVRYDFSNENAWYICLGEAFGGVIIQGGKRTEKNDDLVTFPIAFSNAVLGIQLTKGWGVNAPSYKNANLTNFTMYSHDNRNYKTTWLAVGH